MVSNRTELTERSDKAYPEVVREELIHTAEATLINLSDIKDTPCFERFSVKVKISDLDEVTEVKGGKKKRDVVVKDVTGVCRITLWEEEIDKVEKEKSY